MTILEPKCVFAAKARRIENKKKFECVPSYDFSSIFQTHRRKNKRGESAVRVPAQRGHLS